MSTRLLLQNVCVTFPVLEISDWSLKSSLLNKVGATIGRSKGRPFIEALKTVNLDLGDGDRLGIIGHNGAGKSTLLKVLTGIYEPSSGSVFRRGTVASMTEFLMGMDPALSGYENILRRGVFMGLSRKQAAALTPGVEEFCELGDFLRLPMKTYSLGMYIRLAFAIATSIQSDILIMDEMINAGDLSFAQKAQHRMSALIDKSHVVILASHDLALLRQTCRTGIVLEKGEVRFSGLIDEAIHNYQMSVSSG